MTETIRLSHVAGGPQGIGAVRIEVFDSSLIGQEADLQFRITGEVKKQHGLDASWDCPAQTLTLAANQVVDLPEVLATAYPFQGKNLHARVTATLKLKGRWFGELAEHELGVVERAEASAESHADPRDSFDLAKNFKILPPTARLKLIGLFIAGLLVVVANLLVGYHDQHVTDPRDAYLYDKIGKKGRSESPLVKALLGSGGLGLGIFLAIRRQLLRYFTLEPRAGRVVGRGGRIAINALVFGRAEVDLEGLTLRVVAINAERGQYRVKQKKGWATKSFRVPVRAVVLFSQPLPPMKEGQLLEHVLFGEVDVEPAYEQLLPPCEIDAETGIDVGIEIQLSHADLLDNEIEGPQIFDPRLFRSRLRPPASA
jgi:hypothetical protein